MASIRGRTYDHMVEHLPSVDKLGNQYLVTPLFPESKEITVVKIVGKLKTWTDLGSGKAVRVQFQTIDITTSAGYG